jgi:hypothetical protein
MVGSIWLNHAVRVCHGCRQCASRADPGADLARQGSPARSPEALRTTEVTIRREHSSRRRRPWLPFRDRPSFSLSRDDGDAQTRRRYYRDLGSHRTSACHRRSGCAATKRPRARSYHAGPSRVVPWLSRRLRLVDHQGLKQRALRLCRGRGQQPAPRSLYQVRVQRILGSEAPEPKMEGHLQWLCRVTLLARSSARSSHSRRVFTQPLGTTPARRSRQFLNTPAEWSPTPTPMLRLSASRMHLRLAGYCGG